MLSLKVLVDDISLKITSIWRWYASSYCPVKTRQSKLCKFVIILKRTRGQIWRKNSRILYCKIWCKLMIENFQWTTFLETFDETKWMDNVNWKFVVKKCHIWYPVENIAYIESLKHFAFLFACVFVLVIVITRLKAFRKDMVCMWSKINDELFMISIFLDFLHKIIPYSLAF